METNRSLAQETWDYFRNQWNELFGSVDPMTHDAEYHRQWRAKRGARTGASGPAPWQPCGTVAAYRRHLRNGEPTCAACRAAIAEVQRKRNRAKKGSVIDRIDNAAEYAERGRKILAALERDRAKKESR